MDNETFLKYRIERSITGNGYIVRIYNTNRKSWRAMMSEVAYRFSTTEKREEFIKEWKAGKLKWEEAKAQRKLENKPIAPSEDLVGKVFWTSFGYDMTINEYIKVIAVGNKSVTCVEVERRVEDDYGRGAGKSWPTDEVKGEPFKCLVKKGFRDGEARLVGKGESWSEHDGKANYFNTWD